MKKIIYIIIFGIIIFFAPRLSLAYGCMDYGMAYSDGLGYCKCMSGYIWGVNYSGAPYCISGNSYCFDKYGVSSEYDSASGSCKCRSGYVWDESSFGSRCVSCSTKYGIGATDDYLSGGCKCMSGYILGKDIFGNQKCLDGNSVCRDKFGFYVSYNSSNGNCECDSGYVFDNNDQCVKKQNNVYFKLIELDTPNKKALIKNEYDNNYYSVEYRFGCYDGSFSRYLNKQIVVNLGSDFYINVNDKIVLQDDNETCEIKSFEKVDSDFTLFPEEDLPATISADICKILYINSFKGTDGKCYCFLGYSYNSLSNKCDIVTTAQTTTSVVETKIIYDKKLTEKMKGRILLQIESRGEAWYVNPKDGKRYYMADGNGAYSTMRNFGIGVTNVNLDKIKANKTLAKKNSGKILLQVESRGEAYYIDFNGNAHYLKDGAAAYEIMRSLGLGITNSNLNKISE